ncbi:hypothetical protein [Paractinoplanes maris]|uniref:hypothetical protein n=1 Tax=Paractinoplanes maris TaxID=1734446 RepID=UPI00202095C2|nr:hypothetical protein [Actinoplanes maris]
MAVIAVLGGTCLVRLALSSQPEVGVWAGPSTTVSPDATTDTPERRDTTPAITDAPNPPPPWACSWWAGP